MTLGREPVAVNNSVVAIKTEHSRFGVTILHSDARVSQRIDTGLCVVGVTSMRPHLRLWGDASYFYPTKAKVEETYV